jgi:hypothetical protein
MRLLQVVLLSVSLAAHARAQSEADALTRQLRDALARGEFAAATETASRLDDFVQERYRSWLIRDVPETVDRVLRWLPPDTESFWVNQEPFKVDAEELEQLRYRKPIYFYSVDRLGALNEHLFYRAMSGRTVRFAIAAARNLRQQQYTTPGLMVAQDVIYFYFLDGPVDLPPHDETMGGRPIWRGIGKVDSGGPYGPGISRSMRDDENWLALARPNALIMTNSKALLGKVLGSIDSGSPTSAFQKDLPEWMQLSQQASFWGLRHFSAEAKPKAGEPGFATAQLPKPDGHAVGIAVQFNAGSQQLEIRYLSSAQLATVL